MLVLSRFAGAADEMTEALIVNPFDGDEIAEAMHLGLSMDIEERRERWNALRDTVWNTTAHRYCAVFLAHLSQAEVHRVPPNPDPDGILSMAGTPLTDA